LKKKPKTLAKRKEKVAERKYRNTLPSRRVLSSEAPKT